MSKTVWGPPETPVAYVPQPRLVADMTLRDYFAAAALNHPYTASEGYPDKSAEWAYQLADAMMFARETKETK